MLENGTNFGFSVVEDKPQRQTATVIISKEYVQALYEEALHTRKKQEKTYGFSKGNTPLHYIEQNFRSTIVEHLKELLFTHCVLHHLYDSLSAKKIVICGDPDLISIKLQPEAPAEFVFSLANVSFDQEKRWKRLSLKPLSRKNYKDLDRQVENFIEEELSCKEKCSSDAIQIGDWVNFEVTLKDGENKDLTPGYASDLWISLQDNEDDKDLQDLFKGKMVGDVFTSDSVFLQDYVSQASDLTYAFQVTIKERLPGAYFSLDLFRHQFGIKEEEDITGKLVEVFSTRNDITLRRETIEAVFRLLHKQYFFMVPSRLLDQQIKMVLKGLHDNPDYLVYKAQDDFKANVKALAEKQLKEAIIIDAIAYQEGITVDSKDICAYLNLLKRPRMKDFMYFGLPETTVQGHETPQSTALLKRYCLREKTLNYLIKEITQPKL